MISVITGADVETGGIFDPLNFSKDADKLDKFRAVELKHGASSLPPSLPPSLPSFLAAWRGSLDNNVITWASRHA